MRPAPLRGAEGQRQRAVTQELRHLRRGGTGRHPQHKRSHGRRARSSSGCAQKAGEARNWRRRTVGGHEVRRAVGQRRCEPVAGRIEQFEAGAFVGERLGRERRKAERGAVPERSRPDQVDAGQQLVAALVAESRTGSRVVDGVRDTRRGRVVKRHAESRRDAGAGLVDGQLVGARRAGPCCQ